jgi:Protein of unknown function (DUF3788)
VSKGCFVDNAHQPTSEEIRAAVSVALPLWDHLIQFISQTYGGAGDLKFYGKSYGWALRFQKSGKNLLSLYPGDGCFTAQIIIGPAHVDTAMGLELGEHTRQAIAAAHPYPEGRWLYISVTSRREVEDIQQLLSLKAKPATSTRRQRRPSG